MVRLLSPPATGPSSTTTTLRPSRDSRYAVVSPAMPAPTTQTSAVASASNGGRSASSAVSIQMETVRPASLFMMGLPSYEYSGARPSGRLSPGL